MPVPELRGGLVRDEATLRWAAEDFGHVVQHRPRAVLHPAGAADVAAVVTFACAARLPVAARGAGHCTYGQAQTPGGIVIDMARLNQVGEVRAGRVTAQAGALWADVLDAALAHRSTPPVLTDYLHTTVGGTLAVGGVGGATHHHGLQVDGIEELDVVTGAGRLVTCSPDRDRRLFDAVRAGLGQCGIITSATLRLTAAAARARCYRVYYQDLVTFLADQRRLVVQGRFDYLEGQILPGEPEGWRYLLEAAIYYTPPATPNGAVLLDGLGDGRDEDLSYRDFQHRMAPGEAALRATGEWFHPHVWLTVFLPEDATAQVVGAVLTELRAADLGNSGLGLLYPVRTDRLHAPLVRVPDSDLVWLFALLRTASADDTAAGAAMIEANRAVYDRA
ncbi:MAG: FAD-binding protein, partial [Pseudonocardiaceae bacterium]